MLDPQVISIVDRIDPAGTKPDGPLFDARTLRALATVPDIERKLLAITRDGAAAPARRFIAAVALLEGKWDRWRVAPEDRRAVADALAYALAHDRLHNRWGLPGAFVGPFGKRLLSLGAEAGTALRPLLDDHRPLAIAGSEAATEQSDARYCVADLAAWLLATAHRQPWPGRARPRRVF